MAKAVEQPGERQFKLKGLRCLSQQSSADFIGEVEHGPKSNRIADQCAQCRDRQVDSQQDCEQAGRKNMSWEWLIGDKQSKSKGRYYVTAANYPQMWIVQQVVERR